MTSRRGRLQLVLGDAQVEECVLSVGVSPEVQAEVVTPPRHDGVGHRDLNAALASTPVQQMKQERVLAEVKVGLGLNANLRPPRILEVSMPASHSVVPLVDASADRPKCRM